jgi:hypothetical protein
MEALAALALRMSQEGRPGDRVAVALPGLEYTLAGLLVRVVAQRQQVEAGSAGNEAELMPLDPVSVMLGPRYCDVTISSLGSDRITFSEGQILSTHKDLVTPLPEPWAPRKPRALPASVLQRWIASLEGMWPGSRIVSVRETFARGVHARVSRKPVLVVGERAGLRRDLDDFARDLAWPGASNLLDLSDGIEGYGRHPVVSCGAAVSPPPWLRAADFSLVILNGPAAWCSSVRAHLSHVPQLLVLDRAAGRTPTLLREVELSLPGIGPEDWGDVTLPLNAWSFREAVLASPSALESEEDPYEEDLF